VPSDCPFCDEDVTVFELMFAEDVEKYDGDLNLEQQIAMLANGVKPLFYFLNHFFVLNLNYWVNVLVN